jgi:probable phosphoglycerate mutase
MRHGAVDYFRPDGSAVPPDHVALNAAGREQADAAGRLFGEAGLRFDRVLCSGLPRTRETAERALRAAGLEGLAIEVDERLHEIKPGRLSDIPRDEVEDAFLGAFTCGPGVEQHRFLGGETVGAMLDRVLPAFDALLADPGWSQLLLVLHGGVNRALLSRAMAGDRAFFGRIEQTPACINLIDVGAGDLVVRAVNLAPTQWLHQHEHLTTMEKLLKQYLRLQG